MTTQAAPPLERVRHLTSAVRRLKQDALELEASLAAELQRVHPSFRESARNFVHYLALRQTDIRPLQVQLIESGLTSLGVVEPHVMATLDAVLEVLRRLEGDDAPAPASEAPVTVAGAVRRFEEHTAEVFGPRPPDRWARIMVTMPTEAATDPHLVQALVAEGMDIMRVNCAHDGPDTWSGMIAQA